MGHGSRPAVPQRLGALAGPARNDTAGQRLSAGKHPGFGGAATSLEALEDEVQARHAELEKKFPQHGPEYQAGMKALLQYLQQQRTQIKARATQTKPI